MEGPHLYAALIAANILPNEIYFSPELLQRTPEGRTLLASLLYPSQALTKVLLAEVSERVAASLTEAQTSQGILCVVSTQLLHPERLREQRTPTRRPALLVLDDIADPGNLGTILRTALAADVEEVLLTPHSVDCYSPKVMRSAAGAHVALPVWTDMAWPAIEERITQHCGDLSRRVFS